MKGRGLTRAGAERLRHLVAPAQGIKETGRLIMGETWLEEGLRE